MNFDEMSITEIERRATDAQQLHHEAERELLNLLDYLEMTGRYRENPLFKSSTFPEYLNLKFGMTLGQFCFKRRIYTTFNKEVEALGVGTVSRLVHELPALDVSKAAQRILEAAQVKGGSLPNITTAVIDEMRPKKLDAKPVKVDTRDQEISKLKRELAAANTQIAKLKATILEYKSRFGELYPIGCATRR